MGFWIVDVGAGGRAYVQRSWTMQAAADAELRSLLKPYAADDPWRYRLVVQEHPGRDRAPGTVVRARERLSGDDSLLSATTFSSETDKETDP